jgi:hypothetical protein
LVSRRAGEKTQAQAQISAFAEQVFGKEALDEAYRIHKEGPEKDEAESSVSLLQPDLTFKWIHRGIDGCGKSSIIAEGARDGITNEIDEYSKLTDPCLWFRNIPETFKVSYRTETPTLPRVSDTPAQSKRLHLDGDAWEGYLFEVAALELFPGEDLTEFRNILNVKYYGDIKKSLTGDLRIEYSLYESLTSEVFGIQDQGGIDVDSGTGRVTLRDGRLTIRSEKGIRFSDATPFSDELNVVALPWLIWWMSAVIIGGLTA